MPKRISAAAALISVLVGGSVLAAVVPAQAASDDDYIITTLTFGADYQPRSMPPAYDGGGMYYSVNGTSISNVDVTRPRGEAVVLKVPVMGGTRPFEIVNGAFAGKCLDLGPAGAYCRPLPIMDCSSAPRFTFRQMPAPDGRLFWTLYSPGRGYANDGAFDPTIDEYTDDFSILAARASVTFSFVKSAALSDGNGNGVGDVGESVAYSFVVTNTGWVTLTAVSVSDPMVGAVSCPAGGLAPGASVTCTAAPLALTQAHVDAGEIRNIATATAKGPAGDTVTQTAANTFSTGPRAGGFSLEKRSALNDRNGDGVGDVGESVAYSFVVTNTGRVSLSDVAVSDPMVGTVTCPEGSLAPGASVTCTAAPLVLTQAHLSAGKITNTATATAKTPAGEDVSRDATNVWSALAPPEKKPTLAITGIDLPLPGIVALVGALVVSGAALALAGRRRARR